MIKKKSKKKRSTSSVAVKKMSAQEKITKRNPGNSPLPQKKNRQHPKRGKGKMNTSVVWAPGSLLFFLDHEWLREKRG